jgi:ribosome maturation factor RimP
VKSTVNSNVTLVTELIDTTIQALGLDLWGVELLQQGKYSLLRIYIEREEGVTIEDCEKVSRQVSALMDVEDPIAGEYTLEVSSPGMDRPLFSIEHYSQYVGSEVDLKLRRPLDGRRKFKGQIIKVSGDIVGLSVEGSEYDLEFSDIEKASIVF